MKYGYARVSPGGKSESVDAQTRQLTKAGCRKVFRDVHVSRAKTDRAQLHRLLDQLEADDVVMVTRLDRLARSTRDVLNVIATITGKKAGFRSLGDAWADTTTSHGRLMLTVPRRAGGVRARFDPCAHRRRPGAGRGARAADGTTAEAHPASAERGDQAPRPRRRNPCRHRPQLQRQPGDDFTVDGRAASSDPRFSVGKIRGVRVAKLGRVHPNGRTKPTFRCNGPVPSPYSNRGELDTIWINRHGQP
jgi:hypothetical protein